jgi:hypothetical protein
MTRSSKVSFPQVSPPNLCMHISPPSPPPPIRSTCFAYLILLDLIGLTKNSVDGTNFEASYCKLSLCPSYLLHFIPRYISHYPILAHPQSVFFPLWIQFHTQMEQQATLQYCTDCDITFRSSRYFVSEPAVATAQGCVCLLLSPRCHCQIQNVLRHTNRYSFRAVHHWVKLGFNHRRLWPQQLRVLLLGGSTNTQTYTY